MRVTINGKRESIQACSLSDLVKAKGLNSGALVIELNHKIINREHWEQIRLQDNDNVELLSFVGGG
jgi:thiamine biosynthesis protein ThiS